METLSLLSFLSVFKIVIPHFKQGFTLMNAGEFVKKENRIVLLGIIRKTRTEREELEREIERETERQYGADVSG